MVFIALAEGITVGITTILIRHVWGKLYSNEKEVVDHAAAILPLLALSNLLDGIQCVLSGTQVSTFPRFILRFGLLLPGNANFAGAARGCGWQNICSLINLGAYYGVGIPSAVLLAFVFHVGGQVGDFSFTRLQDRC